MANAPFVADLDALLADPAVDGFVICAENTRHLPLLRKALPAGKPVFCEKPLVTNTGDLAEVKALLAQYPTTLFCGYFQPFEPPLPAAGSNSFLRKRDDHRPSNFTECSGIVLWVFHFQKSELRT